MYKSIQITGITYEVDEATHKYAMKRVSHLYHYLSRSARKSTSAEVRLQQVNHDHGNKYEVEIILNVPGKLIAAKDSTGNIIAAIDIVEAKIQSQISSYKSATIAHIGRRGIMGRFKHNSKREL